ncbi:MAG TPA: DUF2723 domain-containing protein [Sandaracinaceae bacterium LLY-WYZ-13_1]|nr:DUF2723 domain-containing protein [Sandaracinaceae bacterium LLY-WYZ-13_1]
MGLLSRGERDPNVRWIALALASGVPLTAYLATASAHDYWLDAGEFTAQAIHLDVAHPPGHPLAGLLGRLFAYVPLGPLPLRVAVAQAFCTAAAAGFLFSALDTTARAMGVRRDRVAVPLALGATWLVACSHAWWFQAVRPEVYGLQALLIAIVVERIVHLEAVWPTLDLRPLYVASLALGLGLANHHLVAFLTLPAMAPTLARAYRARGGRALLRGALAGLLGLSTYVYLPVRAATDPPANLGDPSSLSRFFWVISAKVYQQNKGFEAPQPLADRLRDVLRILGESFGGEPADEVSVAVWAFAVLGTASLGAYVLLRTAGARRVGYVWVALAFFVLTGPAWLMSVRSNPDVLGYMMLGLAAVAALAMAFVAALLARIGQRPDGSPQPIATVLAVVAAVLGLASLRASADEASLASFEATDPFDEERVRRLPPNAVLVAHRPQTVFRHWSVAASEGARPDVTLVPMPFLEYPGVVEALAERDPDLNELLRGYLLEGELRQPDLQSLAARRPLLVEMDVRVPTELFETLVPAGLYYEVVDAGATDTDVLEAAEPHGKVVSRLYTNLDTDGPLETETAKQLVWLHYVDALYYAAVGAREPARLALERALAIRPESPELRGLEQALAEGEGPVEISPFRVGRE